MVVLEETPPPATKKNPEEAEEEEEEFAGMSKSEKHAKQRLTWVRGFDHVLPIDTGWGLFKGPVDKLLQLIKEEGLDVNERDVGGLTPLMKAAARDHTEAIAVLLDNGADINATDNSGYTALHKCSIKPYTLHEAARKLLLERGAKEFPKPKQRIFKYNPGGESYWMDAPDSEEEATAEEEAP